jgi:hypothetical protein
MSLSFQDSVREHSGTLAQDSSLPSGDWSNRLATHTFF